MGKTNVLALYQDGWRRLANDYRQKAESGGRLTLSDEYRAAMLLASGFSSGIAPPGFDPAGFAKLYPAILKDQAKNGDKYFEFAPGPLGDPSETKESIAAVQSWRLHVFRLTTNYPELFTWQAVKRVGFPPTDLRILADVCDVTASLIDVDYKPRWSQPLTKTALCKFLGIRSTKTLTKRYNLHEAGSRQAWMIDINEVSPALQGRIPAQ